MYRKISSNIAKTISRILFIALSGALTGSIEHHASYTLPIRSTGDTAPLFIFLQSHPKDDVIARKFLKAMEDSIEAPIIINQNLLHHSLSLRTTRTNSIGALWNPRMSAYFTTKPSAQQRKNQYVLILPKNRLRQSFDSFEIDQNRILDISSNIHNHTESAQQPEENSIDNLLNLITTKKRTNRSLQWIVYLAGHGSLDGKIAGLKQSDLKQFLSALEKKIWTRALIVATCYGGGPSIPQAIQRLQNDHSLNYPIITKTAHDDILWAWKDNNHLQYTKFVYAIKKKRCDSLAHLLAFITEQGSITQVHRFNYPQIIPPRSTRSHILFPHVNIKATPHDSERKITLSSANYAHYLEQWRSTQLMLLNYRTLYHNDRMYVRFSDDYIPHPIDLSACDAEKTVFIFQTQRRDPYVLETIITKQAKLSDIFSMFWTHHKGEFDAPVKILIKNHIRRLRSGIKKWHTVTLQKSPTSNRLQIIYGINDTLYAFEHGQDCPKPYHDPDRRYRTAWHMAYTKARS